MGAEIENVSITIDGVRFGHATKCDIKRNTSDNTVTTWDGDVNIGAINTGATISFERLVFPASVAEMEDIEKLITTNNGRLSEIVCVGDAYLSDGTAYPRRIIGTGVLITSDEESWSPSDGISDSFEVKVNNLTKQFK